MFVGTPDAGAQLLGPDSLPTPVISLHELDC
jgi:hypothetical protein